MIIGGQAVLVHGEPRLTKDIDITLGIGVEELDRVVNLVRDIGLKHLISDAEDFVKKTMVLPVIDEESGIRVDFIFSFSLYEKQAIERAIDIRLEEVVIKFASLDVRAILLKNPNYDVEYIRNWLSEFDRSLGENFLETFNDLEEKISRTN